MHAEQTAEPSQGNTLGELVKSLSCTLANLSWVSFVDATRGRSCIAPLVDTLPHPASSLLEELRRVGAPIVYTTPEWSLEQRDAAMARGSHKSASEHLEFLEEEMRDMVAKRYWIVLPYSMVRQLPNLRISPLGVVPQRGRRPRIIVDYSFYGLNDETAKLARPEAMQFGGTLERVLRKILTADTQYGPVYMLKVDLSDGFYRVQLKPEDVPGLGVALPTVDGGEPRVALPLVLPMGWTESPPQFCAATETITDLTNRFTTEHPLDPPVHPLESAAGSPPEQLAPDNRLVITVPAPEPLGQPAETYHLPRELPPSRRKRRRKGPLAYTDVFVDDEIMLGQGTSHRLNRLRRVLLHANDEVFRPNDPNDGAERRHPVSLKKLLKGDACWATYKIILGWAVDSLRHTLELPPHRKERLLAILADVRGRRRISLKQCHKLLGELRSMVMAIPGGRGLFSQLQASLTASKGGRVRLRQAVHDQIEDFWWLANDLVSRPTRLEELYPSEPSEIGACDAAKSGMGGVWLPDETNPLHDGRHPIVWRWPLPIKLQRQMLTDDNPDGTLTNSDLELAGTVGQEAIIVAETDCRERTVATMCDNTPAVSWRRKGSTTTTGPASYLLRSSSVFQRQHRFVSLVSYLPGDWNGMADDASRRFDLNDSQLLKLFDHKYPQTRSWQLRQLSLPTRSSLTSALQCKRPEPLSLQVEPRPPIQSGTTSGSRTWQPLGSTIPTFVTCQTQYPFYKSLLSEFETVGAAAVASRSKLRMFVMNSWPSPRRSPHWVIPTPDTPARATWTPVSPPSLKA